MADDAPAAEPGGRIVLREDRTGGWLCFTRPSRICLAYSFEEIGPALRVAQEAVDTQGLFAAGYIAYEAAPAFDSALEVRADRKAFPLLWLGLYSAPEKLSCLPAGASSILSGLTWKPSITRKRYHDCITRIKKHIGRGDTYQVNYTYRLHCPFDADPWSLFLEMAAAHDPPYGAFIDTGQWCICSASPELFFRLDGTRFESRPMKGTAVRGLWYAHDAQQAAALSASAKDRAENLMIVDMVRNDMGRVAAIGSVHVPRLFTVERFPTVWQMTSTVRARTRAPIAKIFQALFPPASITGAPKPRTMRIISALESSPRRIYTGAIGFLAPNRRAQFNVAIRTVLVDMQGRHAEYGIGGGIVWDSASASEFEECRIKARVLKPSPPAFELLETVLWTPARGFWLLDYHLRRLGRSAAYFGFDISLARVRNEVARAAARLYGAPRRVRILLSRSGAVAVETSVMELGAAFPSRICLAPGPVDAANPFLYHKTTHRQVYEEALRDLPGASDVLLYNRAGEVTESTVANIAVDLDGTLCTPPVHCGLLPGTLRALLLEQGCLVERAIALDDLMSSRRVFLLNSVRGMQIVRVVQP